jgi:hypothetical protein
MAQMDEQNNELERAKILLVGASYEIKSLRMQAEENSSKAHAWDTLQTIIDWAPRRSQGMSVDIRWQIDEFLNPPEDKPLEVEPE